MKRRRGVCLLSRRLRGRQKIRSGKERACDRDEPPSSYTNDLDMTSTMPVHRCTSDKFEPANNLRVLAKISKGIDMYAVSRPCTDVSQIAYKDEAFIP
jgi:hypothetical protein